MDFVTLGTTGITVNKNGFGALPIQRASYEESEIILRKAYKNGITFFDTARMYSDSESKIKLALSDVRDKIYIATKTAAVEVELFREHFNTSLEMLGTGYVDIYQFHNPPFCPKPGDDSGVYDAMLEAKAAGKIRHIGITCHRLDIAIEAAESGLYEIIQYPVSYLSTKDELDFIRLCNDKEIGVLAMKPLAGGLITDSAAAYAFLAQFDNVLPIWGVQKESELDEFLVYQDSPPSLDERAKRVIEKDIEELGGDFCRGCGYCMPCPAKILIHMSARMSLFIKRSPPSFYMMDAWKESMMRIDDCTNCGHCEENCPYHLETRRLLRESWAEYKLLI